MENWSLVGLASPLWCVSEVCKEPGAQTRENLVSANGLPLPEWEASMFHWLIRAVKGSLLTTPSHELRWSSAPHPHYHLLSKYQFGYPFSILFYFCPHLILENFGWSSVIFVLRFFTLSFHSKREALIHCPLE